MEILEAVLTNLLLLFGLISLFNLLESKVRLSSFKIKVRNGIIIGLITIVLMMNAWPLFEGAFYDGRTVIISVAALFFSSVTALIATLIAVAYRLIIGGAGTLVGILMLAFSLLIGLAWKRFIHKKLNLHNVLRLYLFGLFVHVAVLLSMLFFPYPENIMALREMSIPVLAVFPFAVMLLSLAIDTHRKDKVNEKKYRTLIDNNKLGIFQYNASGILEISNDAFSDMLGLKDKHQLERLDMHRLPDKDLVASIQHSLNGYNAFYKGDYTSYLTHKTKPVKVHLSPITDNQGDITGGVGVVEDLSHEYAQKERIKALTERDHLTALLNRETFNKNFLGRKSAYTFPAGLIICNINDLQVINTSFGYETGNEVIIAVSKALKEQQISQTGLEAYRIGGDEFAVVLSDVSRQEIENTIESIEKSLAKNPNFDFTLSVSFGYTLLESTSDDVNEALNEAIKKLNTNKIYAEAGISTKTIELIMTTLFTKSTREKKHSERVSKIAEKIAETFDHGDAFKKRVKLAARLHDIGKINVSGDVLDKPGKLNKKEWNTIKKHPETGFTILSSVPEYSAIANIILAHHEHVDGNGYPYQVSGASIPLESKIIAVADAYDAMTQTRPYKPAFTKEKAKDEIKANSGTQFDPRVVQSFMQITDRI